MFVLKKSNVHMLLNFEGKDTKLCEGDDECIGALAPVHYQKPTGI